MKTRVSGFFSFWILAIVAGLIVGGCAAPMSQLDKSALQYTETKEEAERLRKEREAIEERARGATAAVIDAEVAEVQAKQSFAEAKRAEAARLQAGARGCGSGTRAEGRRDPRAGRQGRRHPRARGRGARPAPGSGREGRAVRGHRDQRHGDRQGPPHLGVPEGLEPRGRRGGRKAEALDRRQARQVLRSPRGGVPGPHPVLAAFGRQGRGLPRAAQALSSPQFRSVLRSPPY